MGGYVFTPSCVFPVSSRRRRSVFIRQAMAADIEDSSQLIS